MNNKYKIVILLLTVFAFVLLPEASALPSYVTPLVNEYGSGLTCGTCHVNNSGEGARNSYGVIFEKQSNHSNDPLAALKAIGAPPKSNITARATTVTYTPAATSTLTSTPAVTTAKPTETPAKTATSAVTTSKPVVTPARTVAPAATTVKPAQAQAAPGFGIALSIIGLLAFVLLVGRKK